VTITHQECEQTENKRTLGETRAGIESVAAFATASGGVVRFGIADDGSYIGVQIGANTLENLANDIKRNTDPPQFPSIKMAGDDSSAVITVEVAESPIKPVCAFGKPLKRVGRTNQVLSREETKRLIEETTGRSWDALVCREFRLEDMSAEAVRDFLRRAGLNPGTPVEAVLDNLKLRTAEGLTNGAPLLFARDPQHFHLRAVVQCGRFLGTSEVKFLDERTIRDTLFLQLDEAMAFIARNTRNALVVGPGVQHDRIPEYPTLAVREALINALIHRRYYHAASIQLRIYDDRLEVWNPGTLPYDLTIDSLYGPHHSHPRNPLLADAFHRAGLIEQWGSGTLRIIAECETRGLPRPEFIQEGEVFIVRFRPAPVATERENPSERDALGLNQRQVRALEYVREYGSISVRSLRELSGVGRRQAQKDLAALSEKGILCRAGAGPATRYVLPMGPEADRLDAR